MAVSSSFSESVSRQEKLELRTSLHFVPSGISQKLVDQSERVRTAAPVYQFIS
jgi:hypothetical protein